MKNSKVPWLSWLKRLPSKQITSWNLVGTYINIILRRFLRNDLLISSNTWGGIWNMFEKP